MKRKMLAIILSVSLMCSLNIISNASIHLFDENVGPTLSEKESIKESKLAAQTIPVETRKGEVWGTADDKIPLEDSPNTPLREVVQGLKEEEAKNNTLVRKIIKKGTDYYCENENGDKIRGWVKIDDNYDGVDDYLYFDHDYKLVMDDITPDGYYVDENGRWVSKMGSAWDPTTIGWKYGDDTSKFWWNDGSGQMHYEEWMLIDADGNNIAYWYYFGPDGYRYENTTLTVNDYEDLKFNDTTFKFDKKGRWIEGGKPVEAFVSGDGYYGLKNTDTAKDNRAAVLYSQGAVIDSDAKSQGIGNVIWGKKFTEMEYFCRKIKKDACTHCNYDIEEREIYSFDATIGYYIVKNAIELEAKSSSLVVDISGCKQAKMQMACSPDNRENTSSYELGVDVFVDGVLVDEIDKSAVYHRTGSLFFDYEIDFEYGANNKTLTLKYHTEIPDCSLILTNCELRKFTKEDKEGESDE